MNDQQISDAQQEIYARAIALNGGEAAGCGKFMTEKDNRRLEELHFRQMIICCICYDNEYDIYDLKTKTWGKYGFKYGLMPFGHERAMEIFLEQKKYMEQHATISQNVHTDMDGVSYNSITWR